MPTMISAGDYRESKSIHHGGDAMKRSRGIRPCRVLAFTAILFGVMLTTLLPAYSQQEVDPTWHDPWATSNTVAVPSSQPRVAIHKHQRTVKSVQSVGKVRTKRPTTLAKAS
jgi:hypothetical protein